MYDGRMIGKQRVNSGPGGRRRMEKPHEEASEDSEKSEDIEVGI